MFIILIMLNIVTIIEKIYLFYFALKYYNSVEPFYLDDDLVFVFSIEMELI